jgi:hypothetical protein
MGFGIRKTTEELKYTPLAFTRMLGKSGGRKSLERKCIGKKESGWEQGIIGIESQQNGSLPPKMLICQVKSQSSATIFTGRRKNR